MKTIQYYKVQVLLIGPLVQTCMGTLVARILCLDEVIRSIGFRPVWEPVVARGMNLCLVEVIRRAGKQAKNSG